MTRNYGPFRSILVPLDGSGVAEQALPVALAIAERARGKVKLVLVHRQFHPSVLMEPSEVFTRTELAIQQSERNYLREVLGRVRDRLGRAISSAVLKGPVAATLAEYIRDTGTDLVVMTTHGQGGVRRAWLGSVADQLIRTVEVPVLLVRAREKTGADRQVRFGEILLPLDGSPLAEAALEPGAALARLWDGEVSLVQVVPPIALEANPPLAFPTGYDEQVTEMRREAAEDYLRDVAERLRELGTKASGVAVLGGGVAETLLELAEPDRVGLIVIATHGRGGVRRLVLGSVADKLVRAAEVPVLVIRPTGRRARRPTGQRRVQVGAGV
ncbi:MAG TPA: universal stress protein [Gemmatimonadales bacterium]|nr:universal stress protein [Gemmatimonadales bacterium]